MNSNDDTFKIYSELNVAVMMLNITYANYIHKLEALVELSITEIVSTVQASEIDMDILIQL